MRLLFLLSVIFFVVSAGADIVDSLITAIEADNPERVKKLIRRVNVQTVNVHKLYPLHLARSAEMVTVLLDAGINPRSTRRSWRATPLHEARNAEVASALLAAGADPHAKTKNGYTPLHEARNAGVASALIAAGADPHAKDEYGDTPLHKVRNAEVALALIAAGADPKAKTKNDNTPLHEADNGGVASALIAAGADPHAKTKNNGWTPLHRTGNVEVASALLAAGADVNAKDEDGSTPLHRTRNAEVASALLAAGADPNAKNKNDNTPLHLARQTEIGSILLAAGADPKAKNKNGSTPYYHTYTLPLSHANTDELTGCTYIDNPKTTALHCGNEGFLGLGQSSFLCVGKVNCSFKHLMEKDEKYTSNWTALFTATFPVLCRSSEGECPSATDCATKSDFEDLEEQLTSPEETSSSNRSKQSGGVQ